jgi:hypothetical protein
LWLSFLFVLFSRKVYFILQKPSQKETQTNKQTIGIKSSISLRFLVLIALFLGCLLRVLYYAINPHGFYGDQLGAAGGLFYSIYLFYFALFYFVVLDCSLFDCLFDCLLIVC